VARNYRSEYQARKRLHGDLSARQATGHPASGDRPPTGTLIAWTVEGAQQVRLEGLSRSDLRRAGQYEHALGDLSDGLITPRDFRRRFRRWKLVGGQRLVADPDAALAAADEARAAGEEVIFNSGRVRRRPARSRGGR
jgi:hypothetical protein